MVFDWPPAVGNQDTQVLEGVRFWSELEQGVLYAVYQFADTGTSSISRLARIVRRDMIVVGLLRVFFFEKGANYYFSSHELLTKFSISIVVVLLSILPRRIWCGAKVKKKEKCRPLGRKNCFSFACLFSISRLWEWKRFASATPPRR